MNATTTPLSPAVLSGADLDLVTVLREGVEAKLRRDHQDRVNQGIAEPDPADVRQESISYLRASLAQIRGGQVNQGTPLPQVEVDEEVVRRVISLLYGLGRLQDLLDDQSISEINMNGADQVWVTYDDGRKARVDPVFDTDEDLIDWVRRQATYMPKQAHSRAWDDAQYKVEMALPDGSRLVGILAAAPWPLISIRLKRRRHVTLADLQDLGDFTPDLAHFLGCVVTGKINVLISGQTGAGKTTLLRAMCAQIPARERLVVLEHFPELDLEEDQGGHPDVVPLSERPANSEGVGAIHLSQLVVDSRRLNPDRLIIGEIMGPEILDFLEGMSQGNDGGITTIHARSGWAVPGQVANYAATKISYEATMLALATSVDLIVHMDRVTNPDGTMTRWVSSVLEVGTYDPQATQVILTELWVTLAGQTQAEPAAAPSPALAARLRAVGWDPATHQPPGGY